MADWSEPQRGIVAALQGLAPGGTLVVLRTAPEVRMQFHTTPDGSRLRAEISNGEADDDWIRERGWELVDAWGGVWRRTLDRPASLEAIQELVTESLSVLAGRWGEVRSDEFGYLAWQDAPDRAWWQFWKPKGEVDLDFPELGLRRASAPDANS